MVELIARTVNGRDAIHFCAVNKEFRRAQPKLEVLVLGGYTLVAQGRRVAVKDGVEGLTVRIPDGIRGLRIIEQIGARYGAEIKRLYVALPGEATRANPSPQRQLGSTLTDLRVLHLMHRQPGTYTDDDDWDLDNILANILEPLWNEPTHKADRVQSVSQLITSVGKNLQVLDLDCCVYIDASDFRSLIPLLSPGMKRIGVDLTPFRWRSNQFPHRICRSYRPSESHHVASYAEHRARL
jgi:hypothetical protein